MEGHLSYHDQARKLMLERLDVLETPQREKAAEEAELKRQMGYYMYVRYPDSD